MNDTPIDPKTCTHQTFRADVQVAKIVDVLGHMAEIRIKCDDCGEPFRFLGVQAGSSLDRPMCSLDGLELRAPIEPEREKRLQATAKFELPHQGRKH